MMDTEAYGRVCWTELSTPDASAAKTFYSQVFGWEFIDQDIGDMTYTMIKKDDKNFGGIWQIPKDQLNDIPPHWLTYILVENLEQSLKKAEDAGATVAVPATAVSDYGRFAIIQDPTGAHIAFWQNLKSC